VAVATLDRSLRVLAERHQAAYVELRREWYGFDPIHIRLRQHREAWHEILSALEPMPAVASVDVARSLRTFRLLAERQWILGCEIHRVQPCVRETDGSTLSLY
jgi:hypothetical protein